jgi:hypothetical protein
MPGKKNNIPKQITEIDDFVKCIVWCLIHKFYAQKGTVPAVVKLFEKLKENIDFEGIYSGCRRFVGDLNCRCKKTRADRL